MLLEQVVALLREGVNIGILRALAMVSRWKVLQGEFKTALKKRMQKSYPNRIYTDKRSQRVIQSNPIETQIILIKKKQKQKVTSHKDKIFKKKCLRRPLKQIKTPKQALRTA